MLLPISIRVIGKRYVAVDEAQFFSYAMRIGSGETVDMNVGPTIKRVEVWEVTLKCDVCEEHYVMRVNENPTSEAFVVEIAVKCAQHMPTCEAKAKSKDFVKLKHYYPLRANWINTPLGATHSSLGYTTSSDFGDFLDQYLVNCATWNDVV